MITGGQPLEPAIDIICTTDCRISTLSSINTHNPILNHLVLITLFKLIPSWEAWKLFWIIQTVHPDREVIGIIRLVLQQGTFGGSSLALWHLIFYQCLCFNHHHHYIAKFYKDNHPADFCWGPKCPIYIVLLCTNVSVGINLISFEHGAHWLELKGLLLYYLHWMQSCSRCQLGSVMIWLKWITQYCAEPLQCSHFFPKSSQ